MLDIKKLLTKILNAMSGEIGLTEFSWNGSYTATYNGIMVLRVPRTSSSGAVTFYVKDSTAGIYGVGALSTGSISANYQNTISFPIRKGHKYETEYTSGVGTITCRVYKVPSWGGVIVKAFMSTVFSHLTERWWEYVRRKETADEIIDRNQNPIQDRKRFNNYNIRSCIRWCMEVWHCNDTIRVHTDRFQDSRRQSWLDQYFRTKYIRIRDNTHGRFLLSKYYQWCYKLQVRCNSCSCKVTILLIDNKRGCLPC